MRRWIAALGGAVLVLPLVFASSPSLLDAARLGLSLRGKSWEQRREYIFGPYYSQLASVSRTIPGDAFVAVIPQRDADRDIAMFSVYQLYPHRVRVFKSVEAWSRNDAEASGGRVPQPKWVVIVDQSRTPVITLMRADSGGLH